MARENADTQTALNTTKWHRDAEALYLGGKFFQRAKVPEGMSMSLFTKKYRRKLTFKNRLYQGQGS